MESFTRYLGVAVAPLFLIAGCATPNHRIEESAEVFNALPVEQQALIRDGKVGIDFDETAVKLALGKPDQVSQRADIDGGKTVWSYADRKYKGGSAVRTDFYQGGLGNSNLNAAGLYSGYETAGYSGSPPTFNSPFYSRHYGSLSFNESATSAERDDLQVVFTDGKVSAIER